MENTEEVNLKEDGVEEVEVLDAEKSEETASVEAKVDDEEKVIELPKDDFKEKYYYLAAEMQNLQRRAAKDKEHLLKFGNEKILNDMVDVLDNLERTLSFIEKDEDEKVKNIVVGIEMIQKLFLENLGKHGLKAIEALGQDFDPNLHEALAQQPAEDKKNNEVLLVHQGGFTLNGRVLRAAKVVIVKND
jgi:molecular chaperone GrpE